MTNDAFKHHIESDDFQRLLDALGDAPPNEAEGEDFHYLSAQEADTLRKQMGMDQFDDLYKMQFLDGGLVKPEYRSNVHDADTERRIKRVARNFLRGIQTQAHSNPGARYWLRQLNKASGMVNAGHETRKVAAAIKPEMQTLMQTIAWSEFKREIERISGYEHHPIMLLSDLIESAMDDGDDEL